MTVLTKGDHEGAEVGDATARAPHSVRARSVPMCKVCGAPGLDLYESLHDWLCRTPGVWRMVRCPDPSCGLLWLDPAPVEEDLDLLYTSYYTHNLPPPRPRLVQGVVRVLKDGYFASRFGYPVSGAWFKRVLARSLVAFPSARDMLDALIMNLRPRLGGRVLDVGCGAGVTLRELGALGWDVEGVDTDPQAVTAARSTGLSVRLGSLEEQHYPDESFDAVTVSHVIEHVVDPIVLLIECRRVLRSHGLLALRTPNASSLGHERFGPAWFALDPPRHLQVFTASALERVLRSAGFDPVLLRSSAASAAYIHAESQRVLGDADPSMRAARRFRREERAGLASSAWSGEELVSVAART